MWYCSNFWPRGDRIRETRQDRGNIFFDFQYLPSSLSACLSSAAGNGALRLSVSISLALYNTTRHNSPLQQQQPATHLVWEALVLSSRWWRHPIVSLFAIDRVSAVWVSWKPWDSHDAWSSRYLLVEDPTSLQIPSCLRVLWKWRHWVCWFSERGGGGRKLSYLKWTKKRDSQLTLPNMGANALHNFSFGVSEFLRKKSFHTWE